MKPWYSPGSARSVKDPGQTRRSASRAGAISWGLGPGPRSAPCPWGRGRIGAEVSAECRGRPLGFDAAIALGAVRRVIRDLCLRLKQERNAWLAPWLAGVLVDSRAEVRQVPADTWVVPIPLHWKRQWQRGYNQADAPRVGFRNGFRCAWPTRCAGCGRLRISPSPVEPSEPRLMRDAFEVRRRVAETLKGEPCSWSMIS